CHPLRRGRGLVEERSVCDLKAGKIGDRSLEIEKRFEPSLADFRLIRRVRRIPGRIFKNIPLDDRRQDRTIITLPDQRYHSRVLSCPVARPTQTFRFQKSQRKHEPFVLTNPLWERLHDELVEARHTDSSQHRAHISGRWANMSARE